MSPMPIANIKKDPEGRAVSGRCACGAVVELGHFTCECPNPKCDRLYNWCGQELVPRDQWEEE